MAQRFTLDRQSFEQFLAAASLVQQFQKQAARSGRTDAFAQPLLELVDTQKAIDSGAMDVDSAIERIVRLSLRVVGGEGTAVWLFSNDEFLYRAGSGRNAAQDERLRLTVLARVAAICDPSRESFPGQREWAKGAGDSGYYPGAVRSLVVGPIYQNQTVMGALAAFSSSFDAFDQRDAGNIRLLSGLIGNAMERSMAAQTRTVVALPRQQVLRLIEQIVPTLQKLVQKQEFATTNVAPTVAAALQDTPPAESVVEQATTQEPVPTEKVEEVAPLAPVLELSATPTPQNVDLTAQPVAQSSSVEEQEPEHVLNTAALTEELARLSRNLAEIHHPEQIAESTAELMSLSESVRIKDATAQTEGPQEDRATEIPVAQNVESAFDEEQSSTEPAFILDDTAVPGIGVRAALYDDEASEPSQFWPTLRQALTQTGLFLRRVFGAMAVGFARVGTSLSNTGQSFGRSLRRAGSYRPDLPEFPTQRVTEAYRRTQSVFSAAASRAQNGVRGLTKYRPQLPTISTEPLRKGVRNAGGALRQSIGSTAHRVNSFVNALPDLPGFPTATTKQRLRQAQLSAAESFQQASTRVGRIQKYRLRVRLNGRTLRQSVSAFAVLLVMSSFLIMESGLFRSDTTASAGARESQSNNTGSGVIALAKPAGAPSASQKIVTKQATKTAASVTGPTSHLTITDPAAEDIVQNLTRYEVSTLRRQAASGDEEAAFQLGMAYEIGYDLTQNCSKAAEWVTRSAEAGYPAAEYNLGLRYRMGDGVATNPAESKKWLSKAATRRYRPARAALAALMTQEKPAAK